MDWSALVGKTIKGIGVIPLFSMDKVQHDFKQVAIDFTDGTSVVLIGGGDDCDQWFTAVMAERTSIRSEQ